MSKDSTTSEVQQYSKQYPEGTPFSARCVDILQSTLKAAKAAGIKKLGGELDDEQGNRFKFEYEESDASAYDPV